MNGAQCMTNGRHQPRPPNALGKDMRISGKFATAVVIAAGSMLSLVTTTASAAPGLDRATDNLAGMSAPAEAAAPGDKPYVAGAAPGISPAAEQIRYIGLFDSYSCRAGRACAAVWDPTRLQYKVFDLYRCGTYSLVNWFDNGMLKNNQTGGAVVITYLQNGAEHGRFGHTGPDGFYQFSWDPVWKIKPC